jgi:hypothetical protein
LQPDWGAGRGLAGRRPYRALLPLLGRCVGRTKLVARELPADRGADAELPSYLRIEERELEA